MRRPPPPPRHRAGTHDRDHAEASLDVTCQEPVTGDLSYTVVASRAGDRVTIKADGYAAGSLARCGDAPATHAVVDQDPNG